MNRGFRIAAISIGIVFGIGVALTVMSLTLGGGTQAASLVEERVGKLDFTDLIDIKDDVEFKGDLDLGKNILFKAKDFEIDGDEFDSIYIDGTAIEATITEGDSNKAVIKARTEGNIKYQVYTDGDKLIVKSRIKKAKMGENLLKISIELPKGKQYDTVEYEMAAGQITSMAPINSKKLNVSMAAGKIDIANLNCEDLDVEMAAGELNFTKSYVKDADLETAMGEMTYDGDITGNLDASFAVGNLEMSMESAFEDHNYKCAAGAGNIKIGDVSNAGNSHSKEIDNSASSDYNIECTVGNVEIRFEK